MQAVVLVYLHAAFCKLAELCEHSDMVRQCLPVQPVMHSLGS